MSYHLVTREEITGITIYTKLIQDAIEKNELIGKEEPHIE